MSIGQLERSALRKSLQTCFQQGIVKIMTSSHKRGKLSTRYAASWRWMLTLCSISQQGINLGNKNDTFQNIAKSLGIHSLNNNPQGHQKLFQVTGINSIPEFSLIKGFEEISNQSLLSKIESKYRSSVVNPWEHILPEDIGSCYELVKEISVREVQGNVQLVHSDGRRKSGIHHTPFDVTEHMVNISLEKIDFTDDSIPEDLVVCDIAVGAGAFLLQYARILSKITCNDVGYILEKHVIGFDIDAEVLQICSLCFHLERNCPNLISLYHLYEVDTIGLINSREIIRNKIFQMMPESKGNATITTGNPPYVRVKSSDFENLGFYSNKCGNLSAYFLEQAINITQIGKVVCQIVPLSITQSERMLPIRQLLQSRCSSLDIESYDCVPGYLFDQGKIGSNSNSSITQRVAIINVKTGPEDISVETTRLIRWSSKERNVLFENIDKIEVPKIFLEDFQFPMIGTHRTRRILSQICLTNRNLEELLVSQSKISLFIPKAIRYFTTASRTSLNRSELEIFLRDSKSRDLVQVLVNSSYFYWYWRITGSGFQVNKSTLYNLPIPSLGQQEKYLNRIQNMSKRLQRRRLKLMVFKENKGLISNIKYDNDKKLMKDLDSLILDLFEVKEQYPFHALKANSIANYISSSN
jgi:hypothetical protein